MAKTFRPWDVEQRWLFPPSVLDLVPPEHLAHFIRETVREALNLDEIFAAYDEERGYPPFHPTMMTALLLYAYCQGVFSSRRIARACQERVDFMAVTAMNQPDFRTVAKFRKRHLGALARLFLQVLRLCQRAKMVRLGHVALDGTKLKANASKHKAMSYGRMKLAEQRLAQEVQSWFDKAEEIDAHEDAEHGDANGDELPDWVVNKAQRLAKIREAMAALEAEARGPDGDDDPSPPAGGKPPGGRSVDAPPAPKDKAQRNFTDPESKIMKTRDGFIQGYNCQAAVDAHAQVIVAHDLVPAQNDAPLLIPMLDRLKANLRRNPRELFADRGYCSEANLAALQRRRIRSYIATGRLRHSPDEPHRPERKLGPLALAMRTKLRRSGFRSRYRLRKHVVEPVFGQIKAARGFTRFLLRGTTNVRAEWALLCTTHNLLKLAAAR